MIKDLKKFLFKDSLIDIAVAFILATAFGLVVKSFVDDVIMPLIAAIVGKPDFSDIVIKIGDAKILIGSFITVLVNFVIIGTVLFFIVRAITHAMERSGRGKQEEPEAPAEEVILLTEIRDALNRPGAVR